MVKLTFPRYLIVGNEIALDEAGVSSRSRFGSGLICYNPSKPGGKFHFKFYLICDVETFACLRIRLHTPDKSDLGDPLPAHTQDKSTKGIVGSKTTGLSDDDNPPEESDNKQTTGLIHALVLVMCQPYLNSGRVVNMDNYYTSPEVAYSLAQQSLYMRGT